MLGYPINKIDCLNHRLKNIKKQLIKLQEEHSKNKDYDFLTIDFIKKIIEYARICVK